MTTPNGQHHDDPNGSTQQATSTVLALDGWGPVIAEPSTNGANGREPEIDDGEPATEERAESPRSDWPARVQAGWTRESARVRIDPQPLRLIAALAAIAIAVIGAVKLGDVYLHMRDSEPLPAPPTRMSTLRRSFALAIDPSLKPVEPQPPIWERWLG